MPDSFYVREDESVFSATDYTVGPWARDAQHGGPPAALLGRAIEDTVGPDKQIVRVTFDILRPVPVGKVELQTRVVRPGKKVSLVESTMSAAGKEVMRAAGWAIRTTDLELPDAQGDPPATSPERIESMDPATVVPPTPDHSSELKTYLHATEWRFTSGGFLETGPANAWLRTRVPLIEGEQDTPLTKVLAVADSASGVSGALDFFKWLYINTDLSVYLHRLPEGPWINLDAVTTPERSGVALCSARLSDERGPIGTSSQALFIAPR
jgi:hypothetical protein